MTCCWYLVCIWCSISPLPLFFTHWCKKIFCIYQNHIINSFTYFKEISKSILESAECKSLEKDYLILKSIRTILLLFKYYCYLRKNYQNCFRMLCEKILYVKYIFSVLSSMCHFIIFTYFYLTATTFVLKLFSPSLKTFLLDDKVWRRTETFPKNEYKII